MEADGGLEFVLRFLQVVVESVQAAEKQMVVHTIGLEFNDLLILLDSKFQDALRSVTGLHVAERAQIDAPEQTARFEIVDVTLENVLGFNDGVANAAGAGIKLGQSGCQVFGRGVGLNGGPVFLDGLVRQFAAAVCSYLLLVHVREGEVVVGGGTVGRLAGGGSGNRRGFCWFSGLVLSQKYRAAEGEQRAEPEQFFHQES